VTRLQPVHITLVTLVASACATGEAESIEPFVDSNKADGRAPKLHKVDRHKLNVDEPSDLVIVDGQLYTVSDQHSKIYGISRKGNVEDEIDIDGNDLEAVTFDPARGEFLVADETKAKIWHIDASGARRDPFELDADDGNSGIEGLAFDDRGHLFVAKEKDPARIFELAADGTELDRKRIEFAADLSALAFNADDGHLYALSDQDRALFRLDADLEVEYAWRVPVDKPEGLAFDGGRIFIASDSEERLYELAFDDD
jgi:uncharacterized protein YjiK